MIDCAQRCRLQCDPFNLVLRLDVVFLHVSFHFSSHYQIHHFQFSGSAPLHTTSCFGCCYLKVNAEWINAVSSQWWLISYLSCTRSSADADKPARRVYRSVKVNKHSTIPYVRYSFLLCNCNFVFKTCYRCSGCCCLVVFAGGRRHHRCRWRPVRYGTRSGELLFLRYSMWKNVVTLKLGSEITQGQWRWFHSIDCVWFPISVL